MAHESLALLTDLYQLTIAQAYFNDRKMDRATFSLFIRSYPLNRGFFISAGLHDVLKFLENFAVDGAALDYLSKQQLFTNNFLPVTSLKRGMKQITNMMAIPNAIIVIKKVSAKN